MLPHTREVEMRDREIGALLDEMLARAFPPTDSKIQYGVGVKRLKREGFMNRATLVAYQGSHRVRAMTACYYFVTFRNDIETMIAGNEGVPSPSYDERFVQVMLDYEKYRKRVISSLTTDGKAGVVPLFPESCANVLRGRLQRTPATQLERFQAAYVACMMAEKNHMTVAYQIWPRLAVQTRVVDRELEWVEQIVSVVHETGSTVAGREMTGIGRFIDRFCGWCKYWIDRTRNMLEKLRQESDARRQQQHHPHRHHQQHQRTPRRRHRHP